MDFEVAGDHRSEAVDGFPSDVERDKSEVGVGMVNLGEGGDAVDTDAVDIDAEIRGAAPPLTQECGDR